MAICQACLTPLDDLLWQGVGPCIPEDSQLYNSIILIDLFGQVFSTRILSCRHSKTNPTNPIFIAENPGPNIINSMCSGEWGY